MFDPTKPIPPQLEKLDSERRAPYAARIRFYDGKQWDTALRPRERRVTINYVKPFVRKTASYLLSGRSFAVDPVQDAGKAAAVERDIDAAARVEDLLRDIHDANGIDDLDFGAEVRTAIAGDGAYKLTWSPGRNIPVISAPDVANLWWYAHPSDPNQLAFVAHRYPAPVTIGAAAAELPAQLRATPASPGKPLTVTEVWTDDRLETWLGPQKIAEQPNPLARIPFVIFPNLLDPATGWGSSDVADLMDVQREINRTVTQLSTITELSGNPIAVLENVSDSTDIGVHPGAVWELPEKAKAYLLDLLAGGGVNVVLEYLSRILQSMHDLAEIPRASFGELPGTISGEALRVQLDPLVKLVDRKRAIRTRAYRQRAELILQMVATYAPGTLPATLDRIARVRLTWGDVLAADRSKLVSDEVALIGIGVHSRADAADRLGDRDPEGQFDRWLDEQQQIGSVNNAGPREPDPRRG